MGEVADAKQEVRERIWTMLEREGVARFPGARGRIPNYLGAERAAARLSQTAEWQRARALKANPDSPQLAARATALSDGKRVFMAVPKLSAEKPFLALEPELLTEPPRRAASIRGASRLGRPVDVHEMPHLDLVVCGSVAVNTAGVRVGKGGGYSDLEYAIAVESGVVDERTVIATTVHALQVVEGDLPEAAHDFRVDLIVTPEEVLRPPRGRRPSGIVWDELDEERLDGIPVLSRLRAARGDV